jgi:acyl-coenzyme A thioesterase PaaI-like protein
VSKLNQTPKKQIRKTLLRDNWKRFSTMPGGKRLFSFVVGRTARYTGSIGGLVEELEDGRAVVSMRDRPFVRNHLRSVHAIALMNLGELVTGLTVMYQVDGRGRGIVSHLEMSYLKKARGTITGECTFVAPADVGVYENVIVEGILRDDSGDEVARIQATWKLEIFDA